MMKTTFKQLKYNKARMAILRMIAESNCKAGSALPSLRDLAKILPYGEITIRHALTSLDEDGIIRRVSGSGTYLARAIKDNRFQVNILFVFVTDKNEDLPGWGLDRLRLYLAERGIGLSYVSVDSFGTDVVNASENCVGVITGGWITDKFLSELKSLNLPIVVTGNNNLKSNIPRVSEDLEEGAYRLTRVFIEENLRKIALFRGPDRYFPAIEQMNGYLRAMKEAGLPENTVKIQERFSSDAMIEAFMGSHHDIEAILMEQSNFNDFISWCWRTDYNRRPSIGIFSPIQDKWNYCQSKKLLRITYRRLSIRSAEILLDHVIDGKKLISEKIPPFIPSIDDSNQYFIS